MVRHVSGSKYITGDQSADFDNVTPSLKFEFHLFKTAKIELKLAVKIKSTGGFNIISEIENVSSHFKTTRALSLMIRRIWPSYFVSTSWMIGARVVKVSTI